MTSPLPYLAAVEKELLVGVSWGVPDSSGELQFLAPLAIGGTTIKELSLRGTCLQRLPDENVMLQLEVGIAGVRTRTALARLEWRPLREPHKNPKGGDKDPSELVIWGTHVHRFEMNWLADEGRLRESNLPYAIGITPDLATFETLIDFAKHVFRIK